MPKRQSIPANTSLLSRRSSYMGYESSLPSPHPFPERLPELAQETLDLGEKASFAAAERLAGARMTTFLGAGPNEATARFGAAKLFEGGQQLADVQRVAVRAVFEIGEQTSFIRGAELCPRRDERVHGIGVHMPARHLRAPHILGLGFKDGMPAGLIEGLAADGIHVAARLGTILVVEHHDRIAQRRWQRG